MKENYYVCDNFKPSLYIKLAIAGFISTSTKLNSEKIYLLPEIQFEYAVLDFKNLHISKKVAKLLKKDNYTFKKSSQIEYLINEINNYHTNSWICDEYKNMLIEIYSQKNDNFELCAYELVCKNSNKIVAGEIGYKIGKTYTSLTGFCKRTKAYNNYGNLQLILLAKHLEKENYHFWNLGHACLKYKLDLGAKILKRDIFLQRWLKSIKV